MYQFIFNVVRKIVYPNTPAITEVIITAIFALSIVICESNASIVTKIDIVNPIPAKNHAPSIYLHVSSFGRFAQPTFTARRDAKNIPIGLPSKSPKNIPNICGANTSCGDI